MSSIKTLAGVTGRIWSLLEQLETAEALSVLSEIQAYMLAGVIVEHGGDRQRLLKAAADILDEAIDGAIQVRRSEIALEQH